MKKNPWENDFSGIRDGLKEYSDSKRPNAEALENKKYEYLVRDINNFLKTYSDREKIDYIANHMDSSDSDEKSEVGALLDSLVLDARDYLLKSHNVNISELSPSGSLDARDKKIINSLEEIEATYSDEEIRGVIMAGIQNGQF